MAEGLAKMHLEDFSIASAGTKPDPINENAIAAMNDFGIDISNNYSKKIEDDQINQYGIIITLCGDAKDNCPVIDSNVKHIHWGIEDPAKYSGSNDEVLQKFSEIRDIIFEKIKLLKVSIEKNEI
tara:strand:- start:108 stop:482 length:375 start_codon:yes stop_codon:yes gene_type:complete